MKNKKGFGLQFYMLIIAFFVGFGFAFVEYLKSAGQFDGYIGQYNFYLLKSANDAETAQLYIDQSAKNSLQQAIYDLAQNGGIIEVGFNGDEEPIFHRCGKYDGAFVWYQIAKNGNDYIENDDCFNEDSAKLNLEYYFNNILNQFLLNYPGNLFENNFNYETIGNIEILGRAKESLEFEIIKIGEEVEAPQIEPDAQGLVDFTSSTEYCPKGRRCKIKEEAYNLFVSAYNIAKDREKDLELVSGYRTLREQEALWNGETSERYAQRYLDPNIRKLYVCNPRGGAVVCPHMTGNAVDVTFKGKKASELSREEQQQLKSIMVEAGWVKYKREIWHFECCGTSLYNRAREKGVNED